MAAYILVDIEVKDPEEYAKYGALAPAIVAQYGGTYLARGGKVETLEGDWRPKRFVILEFPTMEQAKAWWSSSEYSEPQKMRQASTNSKMIGVEGVG
jgi:uncharacterized protein (DUF1330 family)